MTKCHAWFYPKEQKEMVQMLTIAPSHVRFYMLTKQMLIEHLRFQFTKPKHLSFSDNLVANQLSLASRLDLLFLWITKIFSWSKTLSYTSMEKAKKKNDNIKGAK